MHADEDDSPCRAGLCTPWWSQSWIRSWTGIRSPPPTGALAAVRRIESAPPHREVYRTVNRNSDPSEIDSAYAARSPVGNDSPISASAVTTAAATSATGRPHHRSSGNRRAAPIHRGSVLAHSQTSVHADRAPQRSSFGAAWAVAAHLALAQSTAGTVLVDLARSCGSVDRMIRDTARRHAAFPQEQLVAEIRAMIGSRRPAPGISYLEPLVDVLVQPRTSRSRSSGPARCRWTRRPPRRCCCFSPGAPRLPPPGSPTRSDDDVRWFFPCRETGGAELSLWRQRGTR